MRYALVSNRHGVQFLECHSYVDIVYLSLLSLSSRTFHASGIMQHRSFPRLVSLREMPYAFVGVHRKKCLLIVDRALTLWTASSVFCCSVGKLTLESKYNWHLHILIWFWINEWFSRARFVCCTLGMYLRGTAVVCSQLEGTRGFCPRENAWLYAVKGVAIFFSEATYLIIV